MNKLITALLVAFLATSASAQTVIEFKGVPLGATEAQFTKVNTDFTCAVPEEKYKVSGDRVCNGSGQYGPYTAEKIWVYFINDRLVSADVMITVGTGIKGQTELIQAMNAYDEIITAKYGQASPSEVQKRSERIWTRSTGTVKVWTFDWDQKIEWMGRALFVTTKSLDYNGLVAERKKPALAEKAKGM